MSRLNARGTSRLNGFATSRLNAFGDGLLGPEFVIEDLGTISVSALVEHWSDPLAEPTIPPWLPGGSGTLQSTLSNTTLIPTQGLEWILESAFRAITEMEPFENVGVLFVGTPAKTDTSSSHPGWDKAFGNISASNSIGRVTLDGQSPVPTGTNPYTLVIPYRHTVSNFIFEGVSWDGWVFPTHSNTGPPNATPYLIDGSGGVDDLLRLFVIFDSTFTAPDVSPDLNHWLRVDVTWTLTV